MTRFKKYKKTGIEVKYSEDPNAYQRAYKELYRDKYREYNRKKMRMYRKMLKKKDNEKGENDTEKGGVLHTLSID